MSGMTGRSRTPPRGDVRPLGTPRPKLGDFPAPAFVRTAAYAGVPEMKKKVDTHTAVAVCLHHRPILACVDTTRRISMTLTFKSLSKNGKNAFYTGAKNALRFPLSAFVNKTAPPIIEVEGDFAPAKVTMTKEERKAANAAKPKPTLAEKIAKREAALAKDKAKLAAGEATM